MFNNYTPVQLFEKSISVSSPSSPSPTRSPSPAESPSDYSSGNEPFFVDSTMSDQCNLRIRATRGRHCINLQAVMLLHTFYGAFLFPFQVAFLQPLQGNFLSPFQVVPLTPSRARPCTPSRGIPSPLPGYIPALLPGRIPAPLPAPIPRRTWSSPQLPSTTKLLQSSKSSEGGNPVVLTTVTAVPDPPVPAVSARSAPFKVVVCAP